jgi:hypothetical protein
MYPRILRKREPRDKISPRVHRSAGGVKSRGIMTYLYVGLVVVLVVSANYAGLLVAAQGEDAILYEALTCEEYDVEAHTPFGITNFFEVASPGAYFWFNISYVQDAEISVEWYYPDGSIYFVDEWMIPKHESTDTRLWYDGASFLPITDEGASGITGKYSVELYFGGVLRFVHNFTLFDRSSDDWSYRAELIEVDSPSGSVNPREEFVVKLVVSYDFGDLTIFTPGIWDPETEDLIEEMYDEVEGKGTKTYRIIIQAPNTVGTYPLDAVAFYLVEDEWFYDDDGIVSFQYVVERSEDGGWEIPGYPLESILVGLIVSILIIYLVFTRNEH